jgi:hypothetical protein
MVKAAAHPDSFDRAVTDASDLCKAAARICNDTITEAERKNAKQLRNITRAFWSDVL